MNITLTNRSVRFLALFCLLGVILAGCTYSLAPVEQSNVPTLAPATGTSTPDTVVPSTVPTAASETGAYWPTQGWRTSTPEEQGMDSQKLAQMVATIKERNMKVDSLLVIRHGYLVSETYFGPWGPADRHDMQSVGRSFVATLLGIAIDKGYIDGVDHRIVDFFPERKIANLDQRKKDMTLENVLMMMSGLDWKESSSTPSDQQGSQDWVQFLLDRPMVEAPGTRWNYCSGCSHLFTAILQKTTGMNPSDFAEKNLFKPLGMSPGRWMTDPVGLPFGAGGFELTPRDMAKLGYLYLRDGQWDGQQIVSSEWVKSATQKRAGIDEHFGYGYHWFTVTSMAGYAALGGGGQIVLVIPGSDLVIVTTAKTEESIFELIEKYVIPAVQKAQ